MTVVSLSIWLAILNRSPQGTAQHDHISDLHPTSVRDLGHCQRRLCHTLTTVQYISLSHMHYRGSGGKMCLGTCQGRLLLHHTKFHTDRGSQGRDSRPVPLRSRSLQEIVSVPIARDPQSFKKILTHNMVAVIQNISSAELTINMMSVDIEATPLSRHFLTAKSNPGLTLELSVRSNSISITSWRYSGRTEGLGSSWSLSTNWVVVVVVVLY